MNLKRRETLRLTAIIGLMAVTGLITQAEAAEWNKAAFDGKSLDDVLKSLGGSSADKSTAITINAPDIAENGAVVPLAVSTSLPSSMDTLSGRYQFRFLELRFVQPFVSHQ